MERKPLPLKAMLLCFVLLAAAFFIFLAPVLLRETRNILVSRENGSGTLYGIAVAAAVFLPALAIAVLLAAYRKQALELRKVQEQLVNAQELLHIISRAPQTPKTKSGAGIPEFASDSGSRAGNGKTPAFTGNVLLCEDNEMSRKVICNHLIKLGLRVTVAVNGVECLEYVRRRASGREKPFDLIFMDIHMPVMGGLEAALELSRMGNASPVVALTANVTDDDIHVYKAHGMADYLGKPFKAQELWDCLCKYFAPRTEPRSPDSCHDAPFSAENEVPEKLKSDFVKDNRYVFNDLNQAVDAGDIKLAHRMAHTLKGVAGLVGKTALAQAAGDIERSLDGGKAEFTRRQMDALGRELDAVLEEFAPACKEPVFHEPPDKMLDTAEALSLLNRLAPMLKAGDVDCLELTERLRAVKGSERLVEQIEEYDFELARETLADVRASLGE